MDIEKIKEDWRQRGFSCDEWVDPPGKVWEDYVHDVDEVFMVREGVMELLLAGRTWRPAAGEEVLIPAKAVHSVRNVGGATARWLYGYKKDRRNPDACL